MKNEITGFRYLTDNYQRRIIINTKLQQAMDERDLTVTEISRITGISDEQIRNLLKGECSNPTVKTVKKLAKTLRVKVTELGFF